MNEVNKASTIDEVAVEFKNKGFVLGLGFEITGVSEDKAVDGSLFRGYNVWFKPAHCEIEQRVYIRRGTDLLTFNGKVHDFLELKRKNPNYR